MDFLRLSDPQQCAPDSRTSGVQIKPSSKNELVLFSKLHLFISQGSGKAQLGLRHENLVSVRSRLSPCRYLCLYLVLSHSTGILTAHSQINNNNKDVRAQMKTSNELMHLRCM